MAELDQSLVRKLAEWTPGEPPVTTVYLSVDGRIYPRRQDYEVRLDNLLRSLRERSRSMGKEQRRSVERDTDAIRTWVSDRFERNSTRGLAFFSSSAAGLWEDIELSRPVRNQAFLMPNADVLQLEAILETYESFCTVLVASEKARIFLAEVGRIEEQTGLLDDVPGRHDQGGWSQSRFQRHVDEHRQKHLKHTAEVLFRFYKRREFDHLILSGPDEVVAELEGELHDYLRQRILARIGLPATATAAEVLERSLHLEEDMERRREARAVERLIADASAGREAVAGIDPTLEALAMNRADALLVDSDLHAPGVECVSCGRLASRGRRCPACRSSTRDVPDVVEAAVSQAFRGGSRVETITGEPRLVELGGIGALLRY